MGLLENAARNMSLRKVRQSVQAVYDDKRLIFKGYGVVEYKPKDSVKESMTADELAGRLWDNMNSQMGSYDARLSLVAVGITPDDVKDIIVKLSQREGK